LLVCRNILGNIHSFSFRWVDVYKRKTGSTLSNSYRSSNLNFQEDYPEQLSYFSYNNKVTSLPLISHKAVYYQQKEEKQ